MRKERGQWRQDGDGKARSYAREGGKESENGREGEGCQTTLEKREQTLPAGRESRATSEQG